MEAKYQVKYKGTDVTVFMSFGLLQELTTMAAADGLEFMVPLSGLMLYPGRTPAYLTAMLRRRTSDSKYGYPGKLTFDEDEIEPEAVEGLLAWMSEHVTNFFVQRAKATKGTAKMIEDLTGTTTIPPEARSTGG